MDESDFEVRQARRLRRGHLRAADAAAAVVLAGLDVLVAGNLLKDRPGFAPPFLASVLVAAVLAVLIAVRRLWPLGGVWAALAVSAAAALAGVLWDPFAATALALYMVAAVRPPRRSLRTLTWCLVVATAGVWIPHAVHTPHGLPLTLGWTVATWLLLAAAWAAGALVRARRWDRECLRERQAHQILIDERVRIARELHDVVTHGMGLIAVKAGIANHIAQERPDEARDALRVIEATSRDALTEMRRLLGVLREDPGHGPELSPPGLAGLHDLVEDVEAAGVQVELTLTGEDELPEAVQLALYRIVQEALTNVIKHAAPTSCRVTVTLEPGQVTATIVNDGPVPRPGRGGHGLVGMRERVAMYGGTFSAGPRPGGGFAVAATLPHDRRAGGR